MSERLQADAELVLVTFTTTELLDEYQQRRELSVPILIDGDREVYAAYGLGAREHRPDLGVGDPATVRADPRGSDRGWSDLAPTTEDTRQLGGDFVIAPDGRLSWGFWSEGPADRPSVDEVLDAVERAAAT